jgi:oxygen-independent coproporphyrinogen-3 oxidase
MVDNGENTNQEISYRYSGPETYHAVIGQIMAYLGYVGGHEEETVRARVSLTEVLGFYTLACDFLADNKVWHSEALLLRRQHWQEDAKQCLLHWHDRYLQQDPGQWGTLIGVRPTKLVHHLFDRGMSDDEAAEQLRQHYHTRPDVAEWLVAMARLQRPYVTHLGNKVALYIGIPYCSSHCLYCSFPSCLVGNTTESKLNDFAAAVLLDIENVRSLCEQYGLETDSIYIGGGTPTCLPSAILGTIIQAVAKSFPQVSEWTVEAGRPDTATMDKLKLLRHYGVDRVSVNPQTMQQPLLDLMGRKHRVEDIYTMFDNCRQAGFKTVNMDFIAGLPEQTLQDMQENMEIVCQLVPENVTIHTLALKKRAPLFNHPLRQKIPPSSVVSQMLADCDMVLAAHGYISYYMYRQKYMAASFANVGYAQPWHIGKYNIQMMEERQTVFAVGPGGANKFMAGPDTKLEKLYMPKDMTAYVKTVKDKLALRSQLCRIIYRGDD